MTDDDRLEGLLRTRPARDPRYEPALADALDTIPVGSPVVGLIVAMLCALCSTIVIVAEFPSFGSPVSS